MRKIFRHPFILSLIIVSLLIFFNLQGWLSWPKDIFFKLTSPWQRLTYQFSLEIDGYITSITSIRNLREENIRLKQEKEELLSKLTLFQEVLRENEFLRKQIGLPLPEEKEIVLANIISQNLSISGKYILINKGSKEQINKGAAVITAGNFLIGQITEVNESVSKVRLIIDPNSKVNALVQETGITGLVEGSHESDLTIDLLPQGESIKKGEMVVSSGLAGLFPAGLLIGQIEELISSDVQISQRAKLKPVVDFQRLDKVFVIK